MLSLCVMWCSRCVWFRGCVAVDGCSLKVSRPFPTVLASVFIVGLLALVLGFLNPTATPYTTTMPSENPTAFVTRERHLGAGIGLNHERKQRRAQYLDLYTKSALHKLEQHEYCRRHMI